jgi:hypothetical protein
MMRALGARERLAYHYPDVGLAMVACVETSLHL